MKKIKLFIPVILSFCIARPLKAVDFVSQVRSFRLSNGMPWLLVYRPDVPVFSGAVAVRAGGADETPGKTGLAHMFEHMAFKGSKNIGTENYKKESRILKKIESLGEEWVAEWDKKERDTKKMDDLKKEILKETQNELHFMKRGEVAQTLTRFGAADLNAFTTKDITGYHASMPEKQFALWAYVFSEMILDPVMREFYQERDVVMEERRMRYDNAPYGFMLEELSELAFPKGGYHWSTIGTFDDLNRLTMKDASVFHKKYYTPSNMIGVIVGSVSEAKARSVLERFFGRFPSRARPHPMKNRSFAFQGEKRKTIRFPAENGLIVGYYKPKAPAFEDYVFDIIYGVMCDGRTARFYRELVETKRLASQIDCGGFPGHRMDNLFLVSATPMKGIGLKELEEGIEGELTRLSEDLQAEELEKVRQSVLYDFHWDLKDNLELALYLARTEAVIGNWHYMARYPEAIKKIHLQHVRKTARKYFQKKNRIVLYREKGEQ